MSAASAAPPVEPQIKRFAKPARKRLRKLVRTGSRFGDLLFSLPGGGPTPSRRAN